MTPIINPLWFYLINVIKNLGVLLFIIEMFSIMTFLILLFWSIIIEGFQDGKYTKSFKLSFIAFMISAILTTLCPTEDTCYKMMAMSMITPNNITAVGETATDVIDYVVESIDSLLEEEDKESE